MVQLNGLALLAIVAILYFTAVFIQFSVETCRNEKDHLGNIKKLLEKTDGDMIY